MCARDRTQKPDRCRRADCEDDDLKPDGSAQRSCRSGGRRGKREGFGRYDWPTGERFEGTYADDLPNGRGTVTIDGVSFSGTWRRGCLVLGDKRIAIGVPLGTCGGRRAS